MFGFFPPSHLASCGCCLLAELIYFWCLQHQSRPALSLSCFKIMFSALMTGFSISVLCVCLCICPFCACLVSVIKYYKCPLQYMLDVSTPSNIARYDPPAHIMVVNTQTFQPLARVNVLLLSFPMLYPNVLFPLASFDALSSHRWSCFWISIPTRFCSLSVWHQIICPETVVSLKGSYGNEWGANTEVPRK